LNLAVDPLASQSILYHLTKLHWILLLSLMLFL